MHRVNRLVCWLSLFGILTINSALAESPAESNEIAVLVTVRASGGWTVVESPNFRCWSRLSQDDARKLAESCETWRGRIRETWISRPDQRTWFPKCDVYVHSDIAAYNRELNRPGDQSVGSTAMNFDQGRTVHRRIDVRADASDWSNAALPHELTHVVLGERFGGHTLPRWADEGIAMLSESAEKHRERLENLQETLTRRPTYSMSDLVRTNRVPPVHLRDAFYGQSLALASLLVHKSTPAKFADFVEESVANGIDVALRRHYELNGVAALQQEWNNWTRRPETITFASLPIQVGKPTTVAMDEAQ